MTTAMMTPILGAIDRAGYAYINILGGAVFDVCVRYLQENPWERIGLLCEHLATPCDALTRAQSLYTFELFPMTSLRSTRTRWPGAASRC